jgi:hypothetical protein
MIKNELANPKNLRFIIEELDTLKGINAEDYVMKKMESQKYDVEKSQSINGTPDLFCKNEEEEFYVEVKIKNDGLRPSQARWVLENPDKLVYVYYIIKKRKYPPTKLQSQVSRVHKGKEYLKTFMVVPNRIIKELGWEGNEEIDAKIEGDGIIITKK